MIASGVRRIRAGHAASVGRAERGDRSRHGAFHGCAIQAGTGHVPCWGDDDGHATASVHVGGTQGAVRGDHTVAIRYLPEPSAILLQATGLTSLAALAERRQRRARV